MRGIRARHALARVGLAALSLLVVSVLSPAGCFDEKVFDMDVGEVVERLPEGTTRCDSYIVAPGGNNYSRMTRAIFYFVGLCYMFLGIAIISDMFMAAIETITSKEKKVVTVLDDGTRDTLTFRVWNETVANLTLMALGSSAPEILLSVIETLQNINQEPGELGPSTIIGSAAFNLLCISAVCMVAVPDGEVRRVKEIGVYTITSMTSIFAYVWLLIVLKLSSENYITLAEAFITLAFFPLLVLCAWLQDNAWFRKGRTQVHLGNDQVVGGSKHTHEGNGDPGRGGGDGERVLDGRERERVGSKIKEVKLLGENGKHGRHAEHENEEAAVQAVSKALVQAKLPKHWSRAHYRSSAVRGLSGKPRVLPSKKMREHRGIIDIFDETTGRGGENLSAIFEFSNPTYSVMENAGFVEVDVVCKRATSRVPELKARPLVVEYATADGTAHAGSDYIPCHGRIEFAPDETRKTISVSIIDDNEYEDDEVFFLRLSNPGEGTAVGKIGIAAITIIDDDLPGSLTFNTRKVFVKESDGEALVTVSRANGCSGTVTVSYATRDGTAKSGLDYLEAKGTLTFAHGETTKQIRVPILQDEEEESTETFSLELSNPTGGAQIGEIAAIVIYISDDDGTGKLVDAAERIAAAELKRFGLGTSSWGKQFIDAMTITGEFGEDGEFLPPSTFDYVMHGLTFMWKVIFAIVPPTDMLGGWAAFGGSLMIIGGMTAVVGELAGLFGCVIGLKDPITAITFVALGTSLPDTFASKAAVEQEEWADAAIGNVVGSNSVNVFLGLGLPWTIAAIIKYADGKQDYEVPAGSLAFSVTIFTVLAVLALIVLALRRVTVGGELGGPGKWIVASLFVFMWLIYVVVVSLEVEGHVSGF